MVYYGFNKIYLAFDAQYKIVRLTSLTYLLTYLVALALKMLASNAAVLSRPDNVELTNETFVRSCSHHIRLRTIT